MRRVGHHMNHANQLVGNFGVHLERQYGFLADPSLPLWKNVENQLGKIGLQTWKARQRNMACHNLLRSNPLPRGVNNLLDLGLNYCNKTDTSTKTTANTFERFRNDVRQTYEFHVNPPVLKDEYISKIYLKSGFKFDPATDEIKNAWIEFERANLEEQKQSQRRRKPVRNITVGQWDLI